MKPKPPAPFTLSYTAPPTIARFMASGALYRGLMGPVGSGKSSGCCLELMARAFAQAVEAGRTAFVAGMGSRGKQAQASSPLTGTLATDLGFLA